MPTTAMPMPGYGAGPLTAERLRELLSYDPDTGLFHWRRQKGRASAGDKAGRFSFTHGYIDIGIDGCLYRAHRLAWLYIYGKWPTEMDHINGVRNDNRLVNLRQCTVSENRSNRGASPRNTSGFKGVSKRANDGKWIAQIKKNGKVTWLGSFDDPAEAHAAYCKAAKVIHGEFARTA